MSRRLHFPLPSTQGVTFKASPQPLSCFDHPKVGLPHHIGPARRPEQTVQNEILQDSRTTLSLWVLLPLVASRGKTMILLPFCSLQRLREGREATDQRSVPLSGARGPPAGALEPGRGFEPKGPHTQVTTLRNVANEAELLELSWKAQGTSPRNVQQICQPDGDIGLLVPNPNPLLPTPLLLMFSGKIS